MGRELSEIGVLKEQNRTGISMAERSCSDGFTLRASPQSFTHVLPNSLKSWPAENPTTPVLCKWGDLFTYCSRKQQQPELHEETDKMGLLENSHDTGGH